MKDALIRKRVSVACACTLVADIIFSANPAFHQGIGLTYALWIDDTLQHFLYVIGVGFVKPALERIGLCVSFLPSEVDHVDNIVIGVMKLHRIGLVVAVVIGIPAFILELIVMWRAIGVIGWAGARSSFD